MNETTEDNNQTDLTPEEINSRGGVPVKQQLILVSVILLLIFGSTITNFLLKPKQNDTSTNDYYPATNVVQDNKEKEIIEPFSEVSIVGTSAYVWDVNNQRALYKKNETEELPLASVTKLMTALLAHELLSENEKVSIGNESIRQDGDSNLLENEKFSRQTLSDLVLMSSSNDGAFALAVAAGDHIDAGGANSFVKAMNVRAQEIGLNQTTFHNPTGLDLNKSKAGAYGTAKDMAFLMEYILKNNPSILELTSEESARIYSDDGFYHDAENTNYYIEQIPNLIGSKTGYTDLAGGNLVIAYDAGLNRPIVISVLGSTISNRFTDVVKLVEATNNYLSQ